MSVHAAPRDSVAAHSSFLSQGRLPTWKRPWLLGTVTLMSQGWGMALSSPGLQFWGVAAEQGRAQLHEMIYWNHLSSGSARAQHCSDPAVPGQGAVLGLHFGVPS